MHLERKPQPSMELSTFKDLVPSPCLRRFVLTPILIGLLWALTGFIGQSGIALAQSPILGERPDPVAQESSLSTRLAGCGRDILPSSNPEYEARVVELINQIRLQHGLLPFKRVANLDNASRFHATDMAIDDYFSHNSYDRVNNQLVEVCAWSTRIQTYYNNYSILAENIAAGYSNPEAVVEGWMNSPGHRSNILNGENWEIGVGYYTGSGSYHHYWVQDLGRNRDVYPLVVNNDASTTSTGELTLHIYGDWQSVRFRENNGPWSEWQPFHPAMSRKLTGKAGHYTIHAEMRKGDQTAMSNSSIYLTQSNITAQHQIYLPAVQAR
ncbi:MAG: hypothetical protein KF893_05795 [Caldilineaceae bacterium]|nr:hypothetical protein [Caldilineaceae bacterium]